MATPVTSRHYDLDWLRILAFMLLILYHIGMYYVDDWGWHVKSETTSVFLQNLMILSNQWRMSLLFFISAMVLALARQKSDSFSLVRLRSERLLIPLLCAMFIVVVPQVYFEARSQQLIEPGYFAFWWQYINPKTDLLPEHHTVIGLLTWNHLWFLPYLWCYSLLILSVSGVLNKLADSRWLQKLPGRYALLIVVAGMMLAWLTLRAHFPSTHALVNDWYNHAKYLLVFIAGYLFALQGNWWQQVIRCRRYFLLTAVCCYGLIIADRHEAFGSIPDSEITFTLRLVFSVVLSLNHWCWILAIIGYGGYWLNKPTNKLDKDGRLLRYCNDAILPWYMLHQTLIIVFAMWLKPLAVPVVVEVPLLILLTCAGCWAGYEVIRRFWVSRWLFGMKVKRNSAKIVAEPLR